MRKPLHIAVTTQKGGAGKSTLTVHLASTLHYLYGYSVAIMDCDYPQHTISAYRNSDVTLAKASDKVGQQLAQQGIVPYPVLSAQVENARAVVAKELEGKPVDIVFYDLPGTINREGLPELLLSLDYLFVPIEKDKGAIASAMSFLSVISNLREKYDNTIKGVYSFWNKYNRSEKLDMYNKIEELFESKGFEMLQTRIAYLVAYNNDRSTLFPLPQKEYDRLTLSSLVREIMTTIEGGVVVTPSGQQLLPLPANDQQPTA